MQPKKQLSLGLTRKKGPKHHWLRGDRARPVVGDIVRTYRGEEKSLWEGIVTQVCVNVLGLQEFKCMPRKDMEPRETGWIPVTKEWRFRHIG